MKLQSIVLLLASALTFVSAQSEAAGGNGTTITATVFYNTVSTIVTVALIPPSESASGSSIAVSSSLASPGSSATGSLSATATTLSTATSLPASTAQAPASSGTSQLITPAYTTSQSTQVVTYSYGNTTYATTQTLAIFSGSGPINVRVDSYWTFVLSGLALLLGI